LKLSKRKSLFVATLALCAGFATASPALAVSATAPDGGSKVSTSGKTMYVTDAEADAHAAYGYAKNKDNRLDNHSGVGTTVEKTYGFTITTVMACTNIQLHPDSCSSWKS
jgi:hypothetical protein